ncbi:MAG: hypothetical protein R3290_10620 [Acidimicrobiia bacterium]|nr:hypothetical protein [Acidimicrobiia bacterium]
MWLRIRCDGCVADVAVEARELVLHHGADASYEFACPGCGTIDRRPADHRVATTLLALGVTSTVDHPPITERDIAAFMQRFDDEAAALLDR